MGEASFLRQKKAQAYVPVVLILVDLVSDSSFPFRTLKISDF